MSMLSRGRACEDSRHVQYTVWEGRGGEGEGKERGREERGEERGSGGEKREWRGEEEEKM